MIHEIWLVVKWAAAIIVILFVVGWIIKAIDDSTPECIK